MQRLLMLIKNRLNGPGFLGEPERPRIGKARPGLKEVCTQRLEGKSVFFDGKKTAPASALEAEAKATTASKGIDKCGPIGRRIIPRRTADAIQVCAPQYLSALCVSSPKN